MYRPRAVEGSYTRNQSRCLAASKLMLAAVVLWTCLVGGRPKPSLQLPQLVPGSLLQFLTSGQG